MKKMTMTTHAKYDFHGNRRSNIRQIGIGNILHECIQYDDKRKKSYRYVITDTGMMRVFATDAENLCITQYPAKPNRIKQYWKDAPQWLLSLAQEHVLAGMMD